MTWLKSAFGRRKGSPAGQPGPAPRPLYRFEDAQARIAAVGDVHGRIDLLERVSARLDALAGDGARRLTEIYLGDYVDRGSNARATVDFLIARQTLADRDVVCLMGNHEELMLAAVEDERRFAHWLDVGGLATLRSYGVEPGRPPFDLASLRSRWLEAMPARHLEFLRALEPWRAHGGFLFVHAGLRPGVPLESQSLRDLLWIREPFLSSQADFGAVVVHGHTPLAHVEFRPNRIGIDTGAFYSGVLTCLLVTSEAVTTFHSGD